MMAVAMVYGIAEKGASRTLSASLDLTSASSGGHDQGHGLIQAMMRDASSA
jgi:hypothetical protein